MQVYLGQKFEDFHTERQFVHMTRFSLRCMLAVAGLASTAAAQWNSDTSANLEICARASDQTQPKIRTAPDGTIWLSWFDNAASGYDVYIQHLTRNGVELLPHCGLLVANRSYSSTQDYDLAVDSSANAYLTFNDDRTGSDQITVTKIATDGSQPWGAAGTQVSTGSAGKGSPHVSILTTGEIVVGWSESTGSGATLVSPVKVRKVSSAGAPVGAALSFLETGHALGCADIKASDNGSFVVLWTRAFTTSFLSSKYLYAQKYSNAMEPVWAPTGTATAVVVYGPTGSPYGTQGGSIQNGYFPTFVSDGAGGAVFAWYENAGPRYAYVQRVKADGTFAFTANGLAVATPPSGYIMVSNDVSYDPASGEYLCAWTATNSSTQSSYTLNAQKITEESGLAWGPNGITVQDVTNLQKSFVRASRNSDGGMYVAAFQANSFGGTTQSVEVARLNPDGTFAWTPAVELASSRNSGKGRLDIASGSNGDLYMTWADGPAGSYDLVAQNVHLDGTFGARCSADFNGDASVDFFDYLDFVQAFASGAATADFNQDGAVDLFDYLDFVQAFSLGC